MTEPASQFEVKGQNLEALVPYEVTSNRKARFSIENPVEGISELMLIYRYESFTVGTKLIQETEELTIDYSYEDEPPEGRKTNESAGFRVTDRDYTNLGGTFLDQKPVDSRLLEFLHENLSREYTRLLPPVKK